MGILDGLALGAISGAGEAIQRNSLLNQQADLDVQKAQAIAEKTAALGDQQRQDHANQFMNAANNLAEDKKAQLLGKLTSEYDMSDGKPLTADDLHEEDRAKYDAISAFHPEIIKEAGLKSGFIKPEDAVKNDLTAEKMQNLNQYWQGKLDNARDANDLKLTLANMKSDMAGQSKTALAAGIGLIHADIQANTSQLNQLQRDKDSYINGLLPSKDPKELDTRKSRISEFDTKIDGINTNIASNKLMGNAILTQLGIKIPEATLPNPKGAATPTASKTTAFGDLSK
jgi:hypothetical protein